MGWLARLPGREPENPGHPPEHAVIVRFQYGSADLARLFELEDKLTAAVAAKRIASTRPPVPFSRRPRS